MTSAHGEVSKRVEIRRARKLAEIQEQRRQERLKVQEERAWQEKSREGSGFHAAGTEGKTPQWKLRLQQRMNGETANHEGRRRKRKRDGLPRCLLPHCRKALLRPEQSGAFLRRLYGMSRKKVLFYKDSRIMPPDSLTSVC